MRALAALATFSLICGCGSEPAFDARYDEQSRQINATADNIQKELARQLNASSDADAVLSTNR